MDFRLENTAAIAPAGFESIGTARDAPVDARDK